MKNLLLIIDMQKGFRSTESESILPNILKLIKFFPKKIIFSKFHNQKNSLFETQLNWTGLQTEKDQNLFAELQTLDYPEIEHTGYTVLNKELKRFLVENNIKKVFLCGIYTDVCIIKTAMDLFDNNFETFVIKDACSSLHDKINHDSAIDTLKHILGEKQIILTDDVSTLNG